VGQRPLRRDDRALTQFEGGVRSRDAPLGQRCNTASPRMPSAFPERMRTGDEPPSTRRTPSGDSFALWRLGFRPFYLAASAFAALSIVLWLLQYTSYLPASYLPSSTWHGHEMLFGYAAAVIAGFLLTAVPNWTQHPTPTGGALVALVVLWAIGRVLVLTPYGYAGAVVNAAFPIAIAGAIAVPLLRSGNRRNYFLIALLLGLGAAAFAVQLAQLGVLSWPARAGLQAGLDIVLFVMVVIAGRVVPMFTNNGVPGAGASRNRWVEWASLTGVLLLLATDLIGVPERLLGTLALVVALAHAARLLLWRPWRTFRTPLVWILHAAYAWIVIHLALRAATSFGLVPPTFAVHALTIGGIGGLTLGMMTRTARGHTGRPLKADGVEVSCYVLVMLAAVIRVFGGMSWPDRYPSSVVVSGVCWSAAFAIHAVRYWPVLTQPRIDGKPG
jgi:uncharacterized protein involved in response to NO